MDPDLDRGSEFDPRHPAPAWNAHEEERGFVDPVMDDEDRDDTNDNPLPLITRLEGLTMPDQPFDLGPAGDERMDGGGGATPGDNPIDSGAAAADQEPSRPDRLAERDEPPTGTRMSGRRGYG